MDAVDVEVLPPARPRRLRAPEDGSLGLVVLFLLCAAVLLGRAAWEPGAPEGVLVEVSGEVARPGLLRVSPATLAAAVEAAGGVADHVPETPIADGDAVLVSAGGAEVVGARHPLLLGERLDLSRAPVDAITAVPGVSPAGALALVSATADCCGERPPTERELAKIEGLSRTGRERLAAVSVVAERTERTSPSPRERRPREPAAPIDINTADAAALERLNGVGPALAAKIVADREARGRFRSVDELDRVPGIGPATLERIRPGAVVR